MSSDLTKGWRRVVVHLNGHRLVYVIPDDGRDLMDLTLGELTAPRAAIVGAAMMDDFLERRRSTLAAGGSPDVWPGSLMPRSPLAEGEDDAAPHA